MRNLLNPAPAAEPLRAVGTGTGAVAAVLALFVAFGGHLTQDQTTAILGAAAVLGPLVVAEVGRLRVYSPATVRRMLLTPPTSATQAAETTQEVPTATPAAQSASTAAPGSSA